jgi:hypothetical protein
MIGGAVGAGVGGTGGAGTPGARVGTEAPGCPVAAGLVVPGAGVPSGTLVTTAVGTGAGGGGGGAGGGCARRVEAPATTYASTAAYVNSLRCEIGGVPCPRWVRSGDLCFSIHG